MYYNISLENEIEVIDKGSTETVKDAPSSFLWDSSSKTKFENYLESEPAKEMFGEFTRNIGNQGPAKFVETLTKNILDCVTISGIKTARTKKKSHRQNAPWFDKECQKLKRDLERLAKRLKRSPNDNNIRENMFCAKRKLWCILKNKKTSYAFSIIDDMHYNS